MVWFIYRDRRGCGVGRLRRVCVWVVVVGVGVVVGVDSGWYSRYGYLTEGICMEVRAVDWKGISGDKEECRIGLGCTCI